MLPLGRPIGENCVGKQSLFVVNRREHINVLCEQDCVLFIVISGGTYSYHWELKG
jgi:hypothetical protein